MSSFSSYTPPSSPSWGIFPVSPMAPNAFASFHQSPRDAHTMYASLSSSATYGAPQASQPSSRGPYGAATVKKIFRLFLGR